MAVGGGGWRFRFNGWLERLPKAGSRSGGWSSFAKNEWKKVF